MATQRLSALESAFVALGGTDNPYITACILEFERPIAVDVLRERVASALVEGSRYRQRIGAMEWVDDDDFLIERHVLVSELPAPGGQAELEHLAGKLLDADLPPNHPPWRIWTVHRMANGRGAVIALIHHALVDGIAGLHALEQILGGGTMPPPERRPRKRVMLRKLVSRANFRSLARLLRDGLNPADQLGINPRHTARDRIVITHSFDLEAVRLIEHAFDVTLNDVSLATVAGALQRFVRRRGLDPAQLHDVRAMVPVARYAKGEHAMSGNKVVLILVRLPVHEVDPVECLLSVSAGTRHLKASKTASGGELLVALAEGRPGLLTNVLRLALRMRAFNLLVTNMPGPKTTLALDGAKLVRIVPIANLWPHQAIGIAIASYGGALSFGIHADRTVIPSLDLFRDDLVASFEALVDAAGHVRAA